MKRRAPVVVFFLLLISLQVAATTFGELEVACPIDGTRNTFTAWRSYGSYVYAAPSKYQLLFFPYTNHLVTVWSCKKCRYTAFPREFENFPPDKTEIVRQTLQAMRLPPPPDEDYRKIPPSERMAIAEKVYEVLGQDERFWCFFYRLKGYFLDWEDRTQEATLAREKALEIAERMQASTEHEGIRKQLLFIAGSMHHFTGDDEAALARFREAIPLRFEDPNAGPENSAGHDKYLTELMKDYVSKIERGEPVPSSKDDH